MDIHLLTNSGPPLQPLNSGPVLRPLNTAPALQPVKTGPALQPLKTAAASGSETFHQVLDAESSKQPDKIADVSKQFEALMIGQMLKAARESSGGGWLGNEDDQEDQTGSLVMEMAEQGFSQAMAARGGLGIAKMVTANLERGRSKTASSDSEAPQALTNMVLTNGVPSNTDSKR
jgi:Rod binding domain-containing protein